jgi:transcriptional regulator with XRE-family HTH domain
MNINERIIAKMKELGMRQADLARATGATKGAVNQWFKGATAPSGENLIKVAQALRVTPEWLQFGKESRVPVNVVALHGGELPAPVAKEVIASDSNEQMLLRLFREMTDDQQEEILKKATDTHETNQKLLEQLLARKRA